MTKLGRGTKCQGNREKEGNELIIFSFLFRARKHGSVKKIFLSREESEASTNGILLIKTCLRFLIVRCYTLPRPMLREISLRLFRKLRQASRRQARESMKGSME